MDESIGKLTASVKIWGERDENGNVKPTYFKELETEPCKRSDVNFNGDADSDAYLFYQPTEESFYDADRFFDKFVCLKNDDAELMGDYYTEKAK